MNIRILSDLKIRNLDNITDLVRLHINLNTVYKILRICSELNSFDMLLNDTFVPYIRINENNLGL